MFWPCETRTSTCRSFATISSGLYRFLAIAVLLDVKDIPQVGPLQWGWIICMPEMKLNSMRHTESTRSLRQSMQTKDTFGPPASDVSSNHISEPGCRAWFRRAARCEIIVARVDGFTGWTNRNFRGPPCNAS